MLLAGTAYAGCYSGGEDWGNKQVALNAADTACRNNFQGDFGGNSNRHVCINGNGKKLEFTIYRLGGTNRALFWDECYDGLQKEINGCDHGGDSSYTNWRYVADPNAGSC
ncbi:hypothetical protein K491DRAFT_713100 [Lophiostoma macrostomum CBS 122681]|uniref:Glycan binding protein Y3-like domain-containing protein n=1 Tax=Lophiostoma macrostomum CBS 122681 TaxID=1314788 RepID=A0A6A6TI25_9PLEO|nr:hypothetical protein K491DRAFT_713100 [Lophiostoma macrostomum CBS 122681]